MRPRVSRAPTEAPRSDEEANRHVMAGFSGNHERRRAVGSSSVDVRAGAEKLTDARVVAGRGSVQKRQFEIGRVRRRKADLTTATEAYVVCDRFDGVLHFVHRILHLVREEQEQREEHDRQNNNHFQHGDTPQRRSRAVSASQQVVALTDESRLLVDTVGVESRRPPRPRSDRRAFPSCSTDRGPRHRSEGKARQVSKALGSSYHTPPDPGDAVRLATGVVVTAKQCCG